jgi:hypothetical protein
VIRLAVHPGKLQRAEGRVAFPGAGWADVSWERNKEGIACRIECGSPWTLLKQGQAVACAAGTTELCLGPEGPTFAP